MLTFIIRRLLWTALVMFVITVVVFIIFFKTPGVDPARALAGRSPNAQTLAEIRAQLGLGRPFPIEYGLMMKKIFITRDLVYTRPWVTIAPGLMILLTVLSLNVLGDGVRDALDPRAKLRVEG